MGFYFPPFDLHSRQFSSGVFPLGSKSDSSAKGKSLFLNTINGAPKSLIYDVNETIASVPPLFIW